MNPEEYDKIISGDNRAMWVLYMSDNDAGRECVSLFHSEDDAHNAMDQFPECDYYACIYLLSGESVVSENT